MAAGIKRKLEVAGFGSSGSERAYLLLHTDGSVTWERVVVPNGTTDSGEFLNKTITPDAPEPRPRPNQPRVPTLPPIPAPRPVQPAPAPRPTVPGPRPAAPRPGVTPRPAVPGPVPSPRPKPGPRTNG